MKKAIYRILAAILAACLLLGGAMGVSAAKGFGADITISRMPTDPTFIPGLTGPDLSGLELTFKLGGVEKILRYDDMYNWLYELDWDDSAAIERVIAQKESEDSFSIWLSYPEDELKIGKNTFTLEVTVSSGNESFSKSDLPITLIGVSLLDKFDPAQAKALRAGLPNWVNPVRAYSGELALYAFTPRVTGLYSFRSSFSNRPRIPSFGDIADALYWFDPLYFLPDLFFTRIDPMGKLFDDQGLLVAEGDDRYGPLGILTNYDFHFTVKLEAGKTYFFLPGYFGDKAPYLVTPTFVAFAF